MGRETIPLFKVYMSEDAPEAATKVLKSGYIGQGSVVDDLERKLQQYFECAPVVTTNSATSAEHIAMHIIKSRCEKRREVLATPLTCTATNTPMVAHGFKIKWVDVDLKTLNMDLTDLERKISNETLFINPVLWGGLPLDFNHIEKLRLRSQDLFGFMPYVLYDCAHAWGSKLHNKQVCNYPGMFTYSMQAIKHVTAVEGGVLVINDEKRRDLFYKRAKLLRWYGLDRETESSDFRCGQIVPEFGYKMNQVDPNAAVGIANLVHADRIIEAHRANAEYYMKELADIPGIQLLEIPDGFDSAWWVFTMLVERRNDFNKRMLECGIATSRVHERNDKYPATRKFRAHLPNLDKVVKQMVCIPVGWWVSVEDREYIVDCIKKGW